MSLDVYPQNSERAAVPHKQSCILYSLHMTFSAPSLTRSSLESDCICRVWKHEATALPPQHVEYLEDVSVPAVDGVYGGARVPEEVLQPLLALGF